MRNHHLGFTIVGVTALLLLTLFGIGPQRLYAEEMSQHPDGQDLVHHTYLPIIFHEFSAEPGLPLQFSSGPLYRVDLNDDVWYLRADSHISLGSNGVEPSPFDPELDPNSIAAKQGELYALAEDGLYKRAADTMLWQQINNREGDFLSAGAAELWYTPIDNPDQVWVSYDDATWESKSDGLTGTVASPVLLNYSYESGYFVVTQQNGQDMLWHANDASGTFQWQEVAAIPGTLLDIKNGFFSRVVDASTALGVAVMVGGGDGKLYEYRFYNSTVPTDTVGDGWVPVWDFGAGNYPLPLVNKLGTPAVNEVAVINKESGKITLYEGVIVEDGIIPRREWQEKPFP